jgi:hypothetical protein
MTIDDTIKMKALKKDKIFSKPIVKCMDYIYENLNIRITVAMHQFLHSRHRAISLRCSKSVLEWLQKNIRSVVLGKLKSVELITYKNHGSLILMLNRYQGHSIKILVTSKLFQVQ